MGAGELLFFHLRRRPELFLYGATGVGELRRGRTSNEQAF